MKCVICNSKKGKRVCSKHLGQLICSSCCGESRNIKSCNSLCEYMNYENYQKFPLGSLELTEVGRGKVILFSESLYLPNINECLFINVEDINISIKSPILISISLQFKINKLVKRDVSMEELYYRDNWKTDNKSKFPFLQVYTIGCGKIYSPKLRLDSSEVDVFIENNHLDTWLPYATINLEQIDKDEIIKNELPSDIEKAFVSKGKFFVGKNSTLFSTIQLDKLYCLDFDVIYDDLNFNKKEIILPLGLFFPFGLVNYKNYKINISKECSFNEKAEIQLLLPYEQKDYKISAIPLENNNILSSYKYCRHKLIRIDNNFYYDRYSIMNHMFNINLNLKSIAKAIFNNIPIFTGIYDTFNKIYEDEYSPVAILIFNNSEEIEKYKVEVEIYGLSYKYIKEIDVEPYKVKKINVSPQLIDENIEKITSNSEKTIYVKVVHDSEVIYEDSDKLLIYPKETFVESLDNNRKDWKIDFSSFIARWITPNDPNIDNIIAAASVDGDVVGGCSNDFYRIQSDMKKIYDKLSNMKYAIRTLTYPEGEYHIQRISLPKNTIKLKSGNCIDLTLLLASCYEAIKLDVYVIFVPGHAFLKVKINDDYSEYIEATCLGKKEYFEALEKGRENYEKYFDKNGNGKNNDSKIVDISIARKSKIFPMN